MAHASGLGRFQDVAAAPVPIPIPDLLQGLTVSRESITRAADALREHPRASSLIRDWAATVAPAETLPLWFLLDALGPHAYFPALHDVWTKALRTPRRPRLEQLANLWARKGCAEPARLVKSVEYLDGLAKVLQS